MASLWQVGMSQEVCERLQMETQSQSTGARWEPTCTADAFEKQVAYGE